MRIVKKKKKGKILKVKQGYNPNSSSMGSIIFVLPVMLLFFSVIFGAVAGILAPILMRNIQEPSKYKLGRLYIKWQKRFFKKQLNKQIDE